MVGSRVGLYGIAVSLFGILAGGISPAAAITSSGPPLASDSLGVSDSYVPGSVDPDDAVTERQLARVAAQLSRQFGSHSDHPIMVLHPSTPVSRLRVVATLVKLAVTGDKPAAAAGSEEMPPDAALIPAWGSGFVAAAVEQGWWPSDRPLHPRSVASWNFMKRVLDRMLGGLTSENRENASETASAASDADASPAPEVVTASAPAPEPPPLSSPAPAAAPAPAPAPAPNVTYTGLILDARGLDVQRAMAPRIVDEDGRVLYPDPNHVPDMTFLQDHGMAAYVKDAQDTPRSGAHPLNIWVVRLTGPGHDDLVISRKSARRLMDAEEQDGFLSRWAVSVLLNNH
jgi:hypothetical protein